MLAPFRSLMLPIALLTTAAIIALVATGDHWYKDRRINRAEVAEWYCNRDGTDCDGPASVSLEANWNQREFAYKIVIVALGSAAVVSLAVGQRLRSRGGT